ncbi:MAG: molecular chaperone TorD family protein [Acidimicrobiia bacterium]
MSGVSATVTEQDSAIARGLVYTFLTRAFAYPSPEHVEALRHQLGPVIVGLMTGDATLDGLLAEVVRALEQPLEALRAAHALVFTHIEPPDYPPYESAYSTTDIFLQADTMADVSAFYRAHGLQVGGTERERPDHIATELEFMGSMALKEAYAVEHLSPDHVEECRRTQRHFLRDHLGCWAGGFGRRLEALAEGELYRTLGAALARWIEADLAYLGVEAVAVFDEPHLPGEMDDGACGLDGACFETTRDVPVALGPRRER